MWEPSYLPRAWRLWGEVTKVTESPSEAPSPDVHASWGLPTPWPLKDTERGSPGLWGWSLQNPKAKEDALMISNLSTFLPGSPPQMGGCFSTSIAVCITSLVSE